MSSSNLLSFLFVICAAYLVICDRCCLINHRELPRYDQLTNDSCSSRPIISRSTVSSVEECKEFAASKKALAFNFVSTGNHTDERENSTCQALQCPEDYDMTTLMPAENCSYYSMYSVSSLPANVTVECIPKTGMFAFSSESLNYTEAQSFCQKRNASLAHVISEERTERLGKLVTNVPRFVGLSSESKERIWKNEFGEPLSCFDYRAWGEGEPSHSRGCVALVSPSDRSSPPYWKVMPCHASLPFICEILPLSGELSKRRQKNRHRA